MEERIYQGIGVSEGIRIGKAYIYKHIWTDDACKDISVADIEAELERFQAAVEGAKAQLADLIARASETVGADQLGVLKGQLGILADPAYCPEIEKLIRKKLYAADKAVEQVTEKFAMVFESMKSDYMKERSADIRDIGGRLQNILCGRTGGLSAIATPVILFADDLTPTDTVSLDKDLILAFCTRKGGKTSHTAIFAKSMGIPAIVGMREATDALTNGDTVIVDGAQGLCILSPKEATVKAYEAKQADEAGRQQFLAAYAHKDAATVDGVGVIVAANIGSIADAQHSLKQGAEAIGLLRTELLYLSGSTLPNEEQQFFEYRRIAELYAPREVIIRTLDIGGDKELSFMDIPKEENPFLGYRAIRLCLHEKQLFVLQLRAILRASAFGKLKLMLPMICAFEELMMAKELIKEVKSQLKAENLAYDENIEIGMMIEVPSAAMLADVFAKEVDFFSIGTNDLVQYTLAVDRGNEKVSYLYDYCNPAVIRLLKKVSDAAHKENIPVGMCGGMAGDPIAVPLLVGMGFDELSMAANAIGKTKYVISKLKKAECESLVSLAENCKSTSEMRNLLSAFYRERIGI